MAEGRRVPADRRRRTGTFLDRTEDILRRLRLLCRDLVRARGNGAAAGGESPGVESIPVDLSVSLGDGDPGAAAALLRRLVARVDEIVRAAGALVPGRVYCHFCEGARCEHSRPPDPRSVFGGYLPTGRPLWQEFASSLLAQKDPRIDALYAPHPSVVAVVREGEALKDRQLPSFGRGSTAYNVLAQVAAGFLPAPGPDGRAAGVAATFQAVESRDPRGGVALELNIVGLLPDGSDIESSYATGPLGDLWPAVLAARSRLREAARLENGRRARGSPPQDLTPLAREVLQHLARELEKQDRQRGRRTRHFETRRLSRERPTAKASEDARRAGLGRVLVDTAEGTFVVLGQHGRIHVYAPDGRQVTSLRFPRPEVEKRLRQNRWRPASGEETARLRALLGRPGRS